MIVVLLSGGKKKSAKLALQKALEKLNSTLEASKGVFFSGKDVYDMVDLYAFPHIAGLFQLKNSVANDLYEELQLEDKYIYLFRWFKEIKARPEFNDGKTFVPVSTYHFWLEEVQQRGYGKMKMVPFRLPMKL